MHEPKDNQHISVIDEFILPNYTSLLLISVCILNWTEVIDFFVYFLYYCDVVALLQDFKVALEGVPSISNITKKQIGCVMKVLALDEHSQVSFRMFGVSVALCERITKME